VTVEGSEADGVDGERRLGERGERVVDPLQCGELALVRHVGRRNTFSKP